MKNLLIFILISLSLNSFGYTQDDQNCSAGKAVFRAIVNGQPEIVQAYMDKGFNPNIGCNGFSVVESLSGYGDTSGYYGATLNNGDISIRGVAALQILFDYGANPDGISHYTTPMYEILRGIKEHDFRPGITCHKPRLMKLLVNNGADPAKGSWNSNVGYWFPSFDALNNGCGEEVIKEYLKAKPDFFSAKCNGIFYYQYDTWEKAVRYVTKDPNAQPSLKWIMDYFEAEMGMPSWQNDRNSAIEWLDNKCTQ